MSVRVLAECVDSPRMERPTVCIIGAGIAGLFAARRLTADGHKVIILESGLHDFDQSIQDLNQIENPGGQFGNAMTGRYRGLGGSSSQWGGRMIPMTSADMGPRDHIGLEAWPLDVGELHPYRDEIEKVFQVEPGTFEEDLLDRIEPNGRIPRGDPDFSLRFPKWPTFRRCNLAYQFRDFIRTCPELDIWLGATVVDFTLDSQAGRLSSVIARDFGGRTLSVTADQFLFAAGTIESTRLLLRLDRTSEGRAFETCRALGRYFNDHLASTVADLVPRNRSDLIRWFGYYFTGDTRRNLHIETTAAAQIADRVPSAFAQVFLLPAEKTGLNVIKNLLRGMQRGVLDVQPRDLLYLAKDAWPMALTGYWRYVRSQLYIPESVPLNLNVWLEQTPRWKNRIVLSDNADVLGLPKARIEWSADADDERTFRCCIERLKAYWTRSGLAESCPLRWSAAAEDVRVSIAETAEDIGHPAGATRMGLNPAESVVGPDLRCHHVNNIWVASASVFPSSGSANPTYTIIQLALRAADKIAAAI